MPPFRLFPFPGGESRIFLSPADVGSAVKDEFIRCGREAITRRGNFTAALAGGSTPKQAYSDLAAAEKAGGLGLDWKSVHLFFGDERCVPADHPDSNYRMARETLLSQVPIPLENIHPLCGGDPPEVAAREGEEDLRRHFRTQAGEFPQLDLIMLGLGTDGHTASLFPETQALDETHRWVVANWVEKLNSFRLTMTFPVLNAAGEILFTATGASKAEILSRILRNHSGPAPRFPAARVRPRDGRLLWFVDEAAAAGLSPEL